MDKRSQLYPAFDVSSDWVSLWELSRDGNYEQFVNFIDILFSQNINECIEIANLRNASGETLLAACVRSAPLFALESLLKMGSAADFRLPNMDHILTGLLLSGSKFGETKLLEFELLLQHGANPNAVAVGAGTLSVLGFAIANGRKDCARLCVKYGGDMNLRLEPGAQTAAELLGDSNLDN